jgi:hypothetical protein
VVPQGFCWICRVSVAVLAIALVGCGSNGTGGIANGSGGSGGAPPAYTFATSVDGGVPLNDLTASQVTQLCADVNAAVASVLQPTYCNTASLVGAVSATNMYFQDNPGSSAASLQAMCATFLMGQSSSSCPVATMCDATKVATSSSACAAKVSDLVTCIDENNTQAQDLLNATPSCASVSPSSLNHFFTDGGLYDTYGANVVSASCEALIGCPGISVLF